MAFEIQTLKRGDSFALGFASFVDEFGVPATTLAAWDFRFMVKANRDDADAAALITVNKAQMVVNNTTGELSLALTPAQLASLEEGVGYAYAFKAKSPGGVVTTLVDELFFIEASTVKTI